MVGELRYRNRGNPALLDLIDIPPARVLDCGCGAGDNARLLRAMGWRVTGVTLDPAERRAAAEQCERVELADLAAGLPFAADDSYELVVLSHILEHLADPATLLAETRRVLAPGGRIIVALPNVAHYRTRVQFLLGRFDYTETGVMDDTHLRFYTAITARELLESNGLAVTAARVSGGLPWWRIRRVLPPSWLGRIDARSLAARPNLLGWQTLFRAVPASAASAGATVGPPAARYVAAAPMPVAGRV